nr:DUF58 domain-containing protein [bacterium]
MITSVGKAALLLIFLTLWNAVNGGLNTLYMVYSALAAGLLISWAGAKAASLAVEAKAELPDQVFAGDSVPLRLSIRNRGFIPLFGVSAATRDSRTGSWEIGARGRIEAIVPYRFTRRGRIQVTDLFLEFTFPFGLFVLRRRVALPPAIVFPSPGEFAGRPRVEGAVVEEAARPRRGAGEEFLSVREYSPGDDVRLISWKLTAKLGRPLVREFAEMVGDRVTVHASGSPPGEATEERIREAAAIARYYIDEGLEVRLVTDEGETGFGRGLIHLEALLGILATLGEGKMSPRPKPVSPSSVT